MGQPDALHSASRVGPVGWFALEGGAAKQKQSDPAYRALRALPGRPAYSRPNWLGRGRASEAGNALLDPEVAKRAPVWSRSNIPPEIAASSFSGQG